MTDTPASSDAAPSSRKRGGGLSSMLLADLKSMAAGMGIAGAGSMKKAQLVDAIKAAQSGPSGRSTPPAGTEDRRPQERPVAASGTESSGTESSGSAGSGTEAPEEVAGGPSRRQRRRAQERSQQDQGQDQDQDQDQSQGQDQRLRSRGQEQQGQQQGQQQKGQGGRQSEQRQNEQRQNEQRQNEQRQNEQRQNEQRQNELDADDDGEGGSRRNRRRRGRERVVVRPGGRNEPDTTILEDDVLVPAAGIIDVLDNYAFVRTSGYLPGPEDVYLSLSMVRRYGLRRGDAVVGQVRQPREGERREKFNPMVRIDSVNGADPEAAKDRPEFTSATPVHPDQRLRLATDAEDVIGRVIDIAAPVGKGQRGLVLAPPRTGTTALLQSIATSVTTNNPECHVMVVLVDTRPEEVTDFQRAVKGEVIASTFDREPADHTVVAELAMERAKRLVELGHDVLVLLDSLTRLGRAYNLAAPANGRVLGGGVDASAVHPTKRFFGAARRIEDGGSLTVLATVPVETGSAVDELFLEEVAGAANLELRLSSDRAAKGIVPAVDPIASGTRHEELLLAPAEAAVVGELRKKLAAANSQKDVLALVSGGR